MCFSSNAAIRAALTLEKKEYTISERNIFAVVKSPVLFLGAFLDGKAFTRR